MRLIDVFRSQTNFGYDCYTSTDIPVHVSGRAFGSIKCKTCQKKLQPDRIEERLLRKRTAGKEYLCLMPCETGAPGCKSVELSLEILEIAVTKRPVPDSDGPDLIEPVYRPRAKVENALRSSEVPHPFVQAKIRFYRMERLPQDLQPDCIEEGDKAERRISV